MDTLHIVVFVFFHIHADHHMMPVSRIANADNIACFNRAAHWHGYCAVICYISGNIPCSRLNEFIRINGMFAQKDIGKMNQTVVILIGPFVIFACPCRVHCQGSGTGKGGCKSGAVIILNLFGAVPPGFGKRFCLKYVKDIVVVFKRLARFGGSQRLPGPGGVEGNSITFLNDRSFSVRVSNKGIDILNRMRLHGIRPSGNKIPVANKNRCLCTGTLNTEKTIKGIFLDLIAAV